MNAFRIMGAIGAGLAALTVFLVAVPADAGIPQLLIVIVGAGNAFVNAVVIFMASPIQLARTVLAKHPSELKVAQREQGV